MIEQLTRRQINSALGENDIGRAAVIAESALKKGQRDAMLLNLVAWRREEEGDFASADLLLRQALLLSPNDPLIITAIAIVRRKEGRLNEALHTLDRAIAIAPNYANAWLERACTFEAGGSLAAADVNYRRAASIDPECGPALAGVAWVAARRSEFNVARQFGDRALALNSRDPVAIAALARVDIHVGDAKNAIDRLVAIVGDARVLAENRAILFELQGDAFDALDRIEDAFDAYGRANAAASEIHSRLSFAAHGQKTQTRFIADMGNALAKTDPQVWARRCMAEPVSGEAASHVFLLGYPRSGTTLVENILASADGVEALEEIPTLAEADRAFLTREDGIARLAELGAEEVAKYRAAYWGGIAARGLDVSGKCLVDMDPLKGMKLPIIARLFPMARIIVMRRDPRDVVWSCYHHGFAPSAAAVEFTDLERTARHYDALMRFTAQCIEALPLSVHSVRYEELVGRFDDVTKAMCDFAGLAWTPALRAFDVTAKRRGVTTASSDQVSRGLYDGTGQWRRYRKQLEPILPILQPWVDAFGYPAE
jgi:Flp pilus assembly protein TadD